MPGKDRLLLAGHPHHLVRKSRDQKPVFLDEADYTHCLGKIRELSQPDEPAIHAFSPVPSTHLKLPTRATERESG